MWPRISRPKKGLWGLSVPVAAKEGTSYVSVPETVAAAASPHGHGVGAGQEARGGPVVAPQAPEQLGVGLCILAFWLSSLPQW